MAVAADRAVISLDELTERVRGISPADYLRLVEQARFLVGGLEISECDLLNEAFLSVLEGRRHCPVDTEFTTFMYGVMRSLASSTRNSADREPERIELNAEQEEFAAEAEQFGSSRLARSPADLVEEDDTALRLLERIDEHFADDETVRLIVMSECQGDDPAEIRAAVGQTELEYKAARKRLRRFFLANIGR